MKKAVVCGASGVIGRALIAALRARGVRVLALAHRGSPRTGAISQTDGVEVLPCSLETLDEIATHPEAPFDAFFHLAWSGTHGAARADAALQEKNILGAERAALLAARLGCGVFVGVGSQAEYGRLPAGVRAVETMPISPDTNYGRAKAAAAERTRALCRESGMRHVWARVFSVYGEGDRPETMVMSAIATFAAGEDGAFTEGKQLWDYLYAADAAEALVALAGRGHDGKTYNVACGESRPLAEYITAIRDEIDPARRPRLGAIPYPADGPVELLADVSALAADTGFAPRIGFTEGIRRTAAWYESERKRGGGV